MPARRDLVAIGSPGCSLRILAHLTPAQRQALSSGVSLPVSRLTPDQRRLLATALQEHDRLATASPDPTPWLTGSLTMIALPLVVIVERRGGATFTHVERASPDTRW